ncbi:hypothetical protein RV14_GL000737 [Enterococcus ratti]|uniref:Uncharacterized protein n=1 Tax=Enterococcus ratti TaxID=150033 RepID=A0A1L8WFM1_9ENTE|nr:hypothetical protein RV14_GL000737 [Enterococcus ratti]
MVQDFLSEINKKSLNVVVLKQQDIYKSHVLCEVMLVKPIRWQM